MNVKISKTGSKTKYSYKIDDYIPVIMQCHRHNNKDEKSEYLLGECDFSEYHKGNNILEIFSYTDNGELATIELVNCTDFSLHNNIMSVPIYEKKGEDIALNKIIDCNNFFTDIYTDGIHVVLSDKNVLYYVKQGLCIIGISNNNEITDIYFTNMSSELIQNAKDIIERRSIFKDK